jgi:phage terminase small subunit
MDDLTEEELRFGPAMQALTDKQRGFVLYLMEHGTDNYSAAALSAGYCGGDPTNQSIYKVSSALAHNPRIQAAIEEEAKNRLKSSAILIVSKALNIAKNDHHKKQLEAIQFVADRIGMGPTPKTTNVNLTVQRTYDEAVAYARELCQELGVDPDRFLGKDAGYKRLGHMATAIDTTFEEVRLEPQPDPSRSTVNPLDDQDISDLLV